MATRTVWMQRKTAFKIVDCVSVYGILSELGIVVWMRAQGEAYNHMGHVPTSLIVFFAQGPLLVFGIIWLAFRFAPWWQDLKVRDPARASIVSAAGWVFRCIVFGLFLSMVILNWRSR
jgi:hypothetical protein